jgi:hypothetical protein
MTLLNSYLKLLSTFSNKDLIMPKKRNIGPMRWKIISAIRSNRQGQLIMLALHRCARRKPIKIKTVPRITQSFDDNNMFDFGGAECECAIYLLIFSQQVLENNLSKLKIEKTKLPFKSEMVIIFFISFITLKS